MDEAGFTKGPWEIIGDDACQGVPFIAIGAGEMATPSYRSVCEVYGSGDDLELTEEDWARANLIAAAPALYEALNKLVEVTILAQPALAQPLIKDAQSALSLARSGRDGNE